MTPDFLIAIAVSIYCVALAVFVLVREERSPANLAFVGGMAALALSTLFSGLALNAVAARHVVFWQRLHLSAEALVPGFWLAFSVSFARSNDRELLRRWRWVLVAAFLVPLALAVILQSRLFALPADPSGMVTSLLPLGWSGRAFFLGYLALSALILMNLEGTLRAAVGSERWRIKFMLLGVGSYFGAQVYLGSQTILYSQADLLYEPIRSYTTLATCVLATVSLLRMRDALVEIQLSRTVIYNSIAVFAIAIYLIAVGLLAEVTRFLGGERFTSVPALIVFLLLLGLVALLLSEQLRQELHRWVVRNFRRPAYDYRREWTRFARQSTSVLDARSLSSLVARNVVETFGVDAVTLWRIHAPGQVSLGASTAISQKQLEKNVYVEEAAGRLVGLFRGREDVVDFGNPPDEDARAFVRENGDFLSFTQTRLCVPLVAAKELVGVMTLNERVTGEPFTLEDLDLLRTIADQTAASLLNIHLSERLAQAKEMEAFQTLSSFFVHDLKNLASMLSLTVQNLPKNYDNPEFRRDALKVISDSVEKMNSMCSRLSTLSGKLELEPVPTDLNALVESMLARLNGSLRAPPSRELRPVSQVSIDQEQIGKVVTNLLLNANDAIDDGGRISVSTEERNGWVSLSVSDDGRGMSETFLARQLFRPFQTTKAKGLGIGLFQSKRLVEAHEGRIEVESVEGRGSTFRVLLPVRTGGE